MHEQVTRRRPPTNEPEAIGWLLERICKRRDCRSTTMMALFDVLNAQGLRWYVVRTPQEVLDWKENPSLTLPDALAWVKTHFQLSCSLLNALTPLICDPEREEDQGGTITKKRKPAYPPVCINQAWFLLHRCLTHVVCWWCCCCCYTGPGRSGHEDHGVPR